MIDELIQIGRRKFNLSLVTDTDKSTDGATMALHFIGGRVITLDAAEIEALAGVPSMLVEIEPRTSLNIPLITDTEDGDGDIMALHFIGGRTVVLDQPDADRFRGLFNFKGKQDAPAIHIEKVDTSETDTTGQPPPSPNQEKIEPPAPSPNQESTHAEASDEQPTPRPRRPHRSHKGASKRGSKRR